MRFSGRACALLLERWVGGVQLVDETQGMKVGLNDD